MEKTDRETHDFMNVESFSQLPFIRPSSSSQKEKSIRLFGKEFGGGGGDSNGAMIIDDLDTTTTNNNNNDTTTAASHHEELSKESSESSRKFECHYCCRNFPTSQALGGHQNAHKRERQHAKRAHLQSTMVNGSFSEAHMYGLMNYHRFTATNHSSTTLPLPPYNNNINNYHHHHTNPNNSAMITNNYNNRFYGTTTANYTTSSSHHQTTPINGNPLGSLWSRYPSYGGAAQNTNTFNHRDHSFNTTTMPASSDGLIKASRILTTTGSSGYMYDSKPSVQDHVSLDLHL